MDGGAELEPISAQDASLFSLKQRQQWILLEMLTPNTSYELQVRVIAQRGKNRTWSPWSQPLAFWTRPAGTVDGMGGGLGKGQGALGAAEVGQCASLIYWHLPWAHLPETGLLKGSAMAMSGRKILSSYSL